MAIFERPAQSPPALRQIWHDADRHSLTNGATACLTACTGPFAVMLGVAAASGVSEADLGSWMFGGFALGGVLSIVFSYLYRMPMGLAWSIPGVVLLGGALETYSFAECVGAFYVTAALITVLGITGWVGKIIAWLPLNIVMGMVAGVFLPFVLKIVTAFSDSAVVATLTVGAFALTSAIPRLSRVVPAIFPALIFGGVAVVATGQLELDRLPALELVRPILYQPVLSWQAIGALSLPLAITVVGIHNLQGFAICRENGYAPPTNVLTTACGLGSVAFALVGTVSTCVTGPVNGILNSSGAKERRYAGGIVFGLLILLFGLFAPFAAAVALALPVAFIAMVGGLAMFPVLRQSFLTAFSGRFSVGALVSFVVTLADVPIVGVGAPFWAIVFGVLAAFLFEREEWRRETP